MKRIFCFENLGCFCSYNKKDKAFVFIRKKKHEIVFGPDTWDLQVAISLRLKRIQIYKRNGLEMKTKTIQLKKI
jgi:hypothetical protein